MRARVKKKKKNDGDGVLPSEAGTQETHPLIEVLITDFQGLRAQWDDRDNDQDLICSISEGQVCGSGLAEWFCSGSLMRLQTRYWLGPIDMWRLDCGWRIWFQDHRVTWLLSGGLSSSLCGSCHRAAHDTSTHFTQSEWFKVKWVRRKRGSFMIWNQTLLCLIYSFH